MKKGRIRGKEKKDWEEDGERGGKKEEGKKEDRNCPWNNEQTSKGEEINYSVHLSQENRCSVATFP